MKRVCLAVGIPLLLALSGCNVFQLFGALAQAEEYQKLVDTPPKYTGLENHTVAVLVDADMTTLYEHPYLVPNIAGGISGRIAKNVPGAKVLSPEAIINWQYRTPRWSSLPYGELCEQLNVDRVVHITILEFRLNPPGNRWLWEGVCLGRVGVVERDGLDPDAFAQTFEMNAKFPTIEGVGRESASEANIQTGLLAEFIKKTTWLFHQHVEPKYPDKYRPQLETQSQKKKMS